MSKFRDRLLLSIVAAGAAFSPALAQAQDGDDQSDEIVVTAQRRAEALQDVPISVTAVTAEALENTGTLTTQDLPAVTPGLVATTLRSSLTPYLRGVGTQSGTTEQAVPVYVDNVYIASPQGSILNFNNIERVEVLKGPQGTLFGRNSTGGLIRVITRDPSETPEARLSLGYGSYDTTTASFYGTIGLQEGLAADLALNYNDQGEGWGTNTVLGNDVNLRSDWSARSQLQYRPGADTTITLAADYSWWQSDLGNSRRLLPGHVATGPFSWTTGTIYDADTAGSLITELASHQYGVSLEVEHEFNADLSLTSTSAYRRTDSESYNDSDGSPAVRSEARFSEIAETLQQEFLLNGTNGALDWTAGVFLYHTTYGEQPAIVYAAAGSPANAIRETEINANSYSAFAQGTYNLSDATAITLGLRYTIEDADVWGRFTARAGNPNPVGTVTFTTDSLPADQLDSSWQQLTWRVALEHNFSDDIMGYISATRGFKSGAYNPFAPADLPVDPEILDAYEIGLKTEWFDHALRVNGAAFFYDYQDIQLSTIVGIGTVNQNAAAGEITGGELEVVYAPDIGAGDLQFRLGATFLDSEYTDFPNALFTVPRPPATGGNQNVIASATGNQMIRTPDVTTVAGIDYTVPVNAQYELGANVNWQHTGEFYWDPDNRLLNDPYDVVNAQLSFGEIGGGWRVRLWGRNLLDTEYYGSVSAAGNGDTGMPGAPLTYGIALDLSFGG